MKSHSGFDSPSVFNGHEVSTSVCSNQTSTNRTHPSWDRLVHHPVKCSGWAQDRFQYLIQFSILAVLGWRCVLAGNSTLCRSISTNSLLLERDFHILSTLTGGGINRSRRLSPSRALRSPVQQLYIAYHSSLLQSPPCVPLSLSISCAGLVLREGLKAKSGLLVRSFSQSATVVTL